ncbi:MAG: CDP-alcohol phosphatidyltransferase family protein [Gemmatimonadetes bacterium]|nr:CDP-alcohol phosphatidyltransferase family protein [Gemmatimonadota bacterium]
MAAAPAVAWLLMLPGWMNRILAFVVFFLAAVSDLWDGHLARRRGEITEFGTIADPIADKLLLVCALIPVYLVLDAHAESLPLPVFGSVPVWAVAVVIGREALITALRILAKRRGAVVSARDSGKRKAVAQNIFLGLAILWAAFGSRDFVPPAGQYWDTLSRIHAWSISAMLFLTVVVTTVSAAFYANSFIRVFGGTRR